MAPQRWLKVVGKVASVPAPADPGWRFAFDVESVTGPWDRPASGRVAVAWRGPVLPRWGDRLELEGTLRLPSRPMNPGEFDDRAYLARQGIFARMSGWAGRRLRPGDPSLWRLAEALRDACLDEIRRRQPTAAGALWGSLLLGAGASPLDPAVSDRFRSLGLAHVLAVSGAQVLIVLQAVRACCVRVGLGRFATGAWSLSAVGLYALMTGCPPSIARASCMSLIAMAGWITGRRLRRGMALWCCAAILLSYQPAWLFDLGFVFSMLATAALLEGSPLLAPLLKPLPSWAGQQVAAALAAMLIVTPLQLAQFGQLSAWALPANLLVLPMIEALTLGGAVLVPLGAILLAFGWSAPWLTWPHRLGTWLLDLLAGLTRWLATLPGASMQPGITTAEACLAAYVLLGIAWVALANRRHGWAGTALMAALGLEIALGRPPSGLFITVLSVGQGDALVIRTPDLRWFLVDAGPAWENGDAGRSTVVPFLRRMGAGELAGVVLTHPHADHLGGMAGVLTGIPVKAVWDAGQSSREPLYQAFFQTLLDRGIPWTVVRAGARARLARGLDLEVLNPPLHGFTGTHSDTNNNAIAMRLSYGSFRMLLGADLEQEAELALVAAHHGELASQVLKACHHGSRFGSTAPFLACIRPQLSLVSVGAHNPFHHPHPSALGRLRRYGPVLRTDRHGGLTIWSDGVRWEARPTYPWGDAGNWEPSNNPVRSDAAGL